MSARAAWRLEQLGFTSVYDYKLGRKDWEAAALEVEGTDELGPIVLDATTRRVATVTVDDTVRAARTALNGDTQAVVVNATGVVVGVLRKESWDHDDKDLVGDAMRLGPATVRPGSQLAPLLDRMESRDVESVIVSDSDGLLMGVVTREAARDMVDCEVEETTIDCECCAGSKRYVVKPGSRR